VFLVCWVSVTILPFGVHCVDEVEGPDEVGLGCAAPNGDRMILVCDFVYARVAFGRSLKKEKALGSAQHLDCF